MPQKKKKKMYFYYRLERPAAAEVLKYCGLLLNRKMRDY